MGKRVTLQTLADALGVSRTTVSNAYNRPDQLGEALRERILATARELGYPGPDPAARRLRSGRRDVIGLLLAHALTDPGAATVLQGVARATGRALLLIPEHGARDAVVDAFCIQAMPPDHPDVLAAVERRLPIVVIDGPRLAGHPFVGTDDRGGARLVAEHLIGLGHRRFGLLLGRAHGRRLQGYREALERAGLEWGVREDAHALLAGEPRPTAILAGSDPLALAAIAAARDLGLSVPGDVSVAGFGDVPGAASARPALTTVRLPRLEQGEAAGRLLTAEHPDEEVILPADLVIRGSTGPRR